MSIASTDIGAIAGTEAADTTVGPIPINRIKDSGAQMRVEMRAETVNDYANEMLNGAVFPPIVVFGDGKHYWLGDGFHRVEATRKSGRETILAEIRQGGARDAILHGVGSNATHGRPNGRAYENTENDWQYLIGASLGARYLDLIPIDGLVDRRNDAPIIFEPHAERDPGGEVSCAVACDWAYVDVPDIPSLPCIEVSGLNADRDAIQDYIVEVWIEKSTQNDWLVPLCRRRRVNLVVGIGEQSEIRSREHATRAAKYGKPVRIIYISDFDPGGRSMPKAVARKVEFIIAKFQLDLDLQLIPLALTPEQCREYRLPRTPIKDTEARKDTFERIFGVGATELDALEALYPGELARLLEAEIDNFLDPNLRQRVSRAYGDTYLPLRRIEGRIHEKYADEIGAIERRFQEIKGQLKEWEEEADDLWQTIADEMEDACPDLSEVEVPRSEAPGKTNRFVLFDSRRDYFTQMDAYNAWRDGCEQDEGIEGAGADGGAP
jgi:hypothetical protein